MISIIIPNYNNLPHLGRCIGSVKRQSYRKWECIIIDDGSTDGSVDEIKKHIQGDERFRLISLEQNAGLSNARNLGMRLSKGEYLCFLDSDDWLPNDSLDCLYGVASVHPDVGRVMGCDLMIWDDGHSIPHIITPGMHLEDSFTKDVDLGHCTGCLYIRKNLPEIIFPKVKIFEDMLFNMGLMFSGRKTFVLNKIVYNYYRHEGTLVSSKLTQQEYDEMKECLKYYEFKFRPRKEVYEECLEFLHRASEKRIKKQKHMIVVIPYLASAAQGSELELAVLGWKKHFKESHTIVVVGDYHPCVSWENVEFIPCPRIEPIEGQYTPHLDHVHKFREVRKHFPDTEGFIYTCDDIYATKDFTLEDVKSPKHPEIGPYFKLDGSKGDDWWSDRMKTGELCKREGLPIRDWVCHLPVYYEWDKLFEIYDKYDCDHNSYIVENIYFSKEFGDKPSQPAKEIRDEVRSANPQIHPIGTMTWITNGNCGWSQKLENILRAHYEH